MHLRNITILYDEHSLHKNVAMYITYVCILTYVPLAVLLMSVNDTVIMVDDGILRESVARTWPLFSLITYVV